MALHGSASANLSPIFFKGNNISLGVNVLIHQDQTISMNDFRIFYFNGTFVGELQSALLANNIGSDINKYPNLYGYFDLYSRNPTFPFSISNPNGNLIVSQAFMRGELSGSNTASNWSSRYFLNITNHSVNICTDIIGTTTGGRLSTIETPEIGSLSEDVHGNLWSIFTTPNAISTGTPGRFGSVIGSNIRKGSTTIIITNSDEQTGAPGDMINQLVTTSSGERSINGSNGEMILRGYKVIALSSYSSTDGYDGILFYGPSYSQPYGYVRFLSSSTYEIIRSSSAPSSWTQTTTSFGDESRQLQNTLIIASETRGALFKISNVLSSSLNRSVAFSRCLAQFISETV
jgi:hypothetical protein